MIHVFKNKAGRVVREVLCYNPAGVVKVGKANHKYDPIKCGWQMPMTFIYNGPLFACRRCHRHIWSKESTTRCPQCGAKLNATNTLDHTSAVTRVPAAGVINTSTFV